MRRIVLVIVPLALAGTVVAIVCCHNNVGSSHNAMLGVANISAGERYAQIQQALAGPGTHEFTLKVDNGPLLCVSYAFGHPENRLYFVMKDDHMIKITRPPPFA